MPVPLAATPRLKNRAWAANRGESGSRRIANGSSKDSSMSLMLMALFRLNGGLFQSKSILTCYVYPSEIHCAYKVNTQSGHGCQPGILRRRPNRREERGHRP